MRPSSLTNGQPVVNAGCQVLAAPCAAIPVNWLGNLAYQICRAARHWRDLRSVTCAEVENVVASRRSEESTAAISRIVARYALMPSSDQLLNVSEAARRLGITTTCLYDWLSQSDRGLLVIRGQAVTVSYFQGGPRGQGRIRIQAMEVERLLELMRVVPQAYVKRRLPARSLSFPGITVPLGRPGGK